MFIFVSDAKGSIEFVKSPFEELRDEIYCRLIAAGGMAADDCLKKAEMCSAKVYKETSEQLQEAYLEAWAKTFGV